jgi:Protein of unknown function (DUF1194)
MPDLRRPVVRTVSRAAKRRFLNAFACLIVTLPLLSQPPAQAAQAVDLKLVLAIDVSGSIDPEEARLQREGYQRALLNEEVIKGMTSGPLGKIALSYVEWAGMGHYKVVVDWQVIDGRDSVRAFVEKLSRIPIEGAHRTSLSEAIDRSVRHLAASDIQATRRIIDISGDGANNYGRLVTQARDDAVKQGITINGLPILAESSVNGAYPSIPDLDLFFRDCVIGGPGSFYVVAHGFDDFARAIRKKLILEIAGRTPPDTHGRAAAAADTARLWRAADEKRESPPCNIGEWNWMSIIQGGTSDR